MRKRERLVSRLCVVALLLNAVAAPSNVKAQGAGAARPDSRPEARPYFYEPSLSPDRAEIAFVSGGDYARLALATFVATTVARAVGGTRIVMAQASGSVRLTLRSLIR